jgi:hypothetical protein
LTKNLIHLTDWVMLKVKHAVNSGDGFTRFDHTAHLLVSHSALGSL